MSTTCSVQFLFSCFFFVWFFFFFNDTATTEIYTLSLHDAFPIYLVSIAVLTLRFGMLAAGVVWGLILTIQNIRQGLVPWGLTIRIAVPATLLTALGPLLSMQLTLQGYDTAIPLQTYQATVYVVILMSVVFGFLLLGGGEHHRHQDHHVYRDRKSTR